MAIAFNAATDGGNNGGSTTSLTFSHTVSSGSDRLLVVGIIGDDNVAGDNISSVTFNGVAMTLACKRTDGQRMLYLYYLLNPDSGAHNVVITAATSHWLLAGAADYTGVAQTSQPDATATNFSLVAASTLTTTITTVADNCWAILVEGGANTNNNPPSAGTGATRRADDAVAGTWGLFDSAADITPAGSYSMTTTRTAADNIIVHAMASFAPATGGGGGATTLTAGGGSFTETGQTVTLTAARKLAAAAGSFSLTGQTVALTGPGAKTLTAEAGSFSLTGQDVNFELAVEAGTASYTLTGQDVTLTYVSRRLAAECGVFTLAGHSASLVYSGASFVPGSHMGIGIRLGI